METIAQGIRETRGMHGRQGAVTATWSLRVRHTHATDGHPMAVVEVLPGCFARMTPHELRGFAAALRLAADDCDSPHIERAFTTYPVLSR